MEIHKRLLVPYTALQMFDLIEAAEHYPAFMPWCGQARIVFRSDEVVIADIGVDYRGVRFEFRTRNPKRRPFEMSIRLEKGPFRRFEGEWRLAPLGDAGCRVEFEMRYDFNSVMARVAGPVFDRIANAMVDAYVARADDLFGRSAAAAACATPAPTITHDAPPAMTPDPNDMAPRGAGPPDAAGAAIAPGELPPDPAPPPPQPEAAPPDPTPPRSQLP